ncbi:MAG: methyltransferase [Oceanospirillaceae bacterium]|nr:methyltransferase [Oceanospirillaceae bacterium]
MSTDIKYKPVSRPSIAACGTHHTNGCGEPLYDARFDDVLAFHPVERTQLAPVSKNGLAWHVDTTGKAAYTRRFERTFGFYCQYAAVVTSSGWLHIRADGTALYDERYAFAGNFQQDVAVVCDNDGYYFHIDTRGRPLYPQRWQYCGDFRGGSAVVQGSDGLSTHIRKDGSLVHGCWFFDLDVFHKGYARAKDRAGWCHVNRRGMPIYPQRYCAVEPYYNGFARCECHDGALVVIDEAGQSVRQLRGPTVDPFAALSADMVGYWRTFTIATAIELGVFEELPGRLDVIANSINVGTDMLRRLLAALDELELVAFDGATWQATEKGQYLSSSDRKSLADAALEYSGDLLEQWKRLPRALRGEIGDSRIFAEVAASPHRLSGHHRMLSSYALHDYEHLVPSLPIQPGDTVLDAGGGSGTLAQLMRTQFPEANVLLGDLPQVIAASDYPNAVTLDLFAPWPISADKILLSRVLHDWPDEKAQIILKQAERSLKPNGCIYVIEMLLEEGSSAGALCDLHLLAVTGGKERTRRALEGLAAEADLTLTETLWAGPLVSVLCLERKQ